LNASQLFHLWDTEEQDPAQVDKGSTTRPRLRDCYTEDEIKALVADLKRAAKRHNTIKKFLAEQLFGKAAQPIRSDPVDRTPNLAIDPSEPGSIPVGRNCGVRNGMGRACAPGSLQFYFCQLCRASACWYSCWYREELAKKNTSYSNGYGISRVSARGTNCASRRLCYLRSADVRRSLRCEVKCSVTVIAGQSPYPAINWPGAGPIT
jgi:hypothetical protein